MTDDRPDLSQPGAPATPGAAGAPDDAALARPDDAVLAAWLAGDLDVASTAGVDRVVAADPAVAARADALAMTLIRLATAVGPPPTAGFAQRLDAGLAAGIGSLPGGADVPAAAGQPPSDGTAAILRRPGDVPSRRPGRAGTRRQDRLAPLSRRVAGTLAALLLLVGGTAVAVRSFQGRGGLDLPAPGEVVGGPVDGDPSLGTSPSASMPGSSADPTEGAPSGGAGDAGATGPATTEPDPSAADGPEATTAPGGAAGQAPDSSAATTAPSGPGGADQGGTGPAPAGGPAPGDVGPTAPSSTDTTSPAPTSPAPTSPTPGAPPPGATAPPAPEPRPDPTTSEPPTDPGSDEPADDAADEVAGGSGPSGGAEDDGAEDGATAPIAPAPPPEEGTSDEAAPPPGGEATDPDDPADPDPEATATSSATIRDAMTRLPDAAAARRHFSGRQEVAQVRGQDAAAAQATADRHAEQIRAAEPFADGTRPGACLRATDGPGIDVVVVVESAIYQGTSAIGHVVVTDGDRVRLVLTDASSCAVLLSATL